MLSSPSEITAMLPGMVIQTSSEHACMVSISKLGGCGTAGLLPVHVSCGLSSGGSRVMVIRLRMARVCCGAADRRHFVGLSSLLVRG